MQDRYWMFQSNGVFYLEDKLNGKQKSLKTRDAAAALPDKECVTKTLNIHGHHTNAANFGALSFYGTDALAIRQLIEKDGSLGKALDAELPYVEAEVVWAAREEMARSVEDILARRTRALFLNARAALRMAHRVAELLAGELDRDMKWQAEQVQDFSKVAAGFLPKDQ